MERNSARRSIRLEDAPHQRHRALAEPGGGQLRARLSDQVDLAVKILDVLFRKRQTICATPSDTCGVRCAIGTGREPR